MNHASFDEWAREKANAHEAPVPANAWEKISGRRKKRRRIALWWWPLAGGLLALGYGSYRYVQRGTGERLVAAGERKERPAYPASADTAVITSAGSRNNRQENRTELTAGRHDAGSRRQQMPEVGREETIIAFPQSKNINGLAYKEAEKKKARRHAINDAVLTGKEIAATRQAEEVKTTPLPELQEQHTDAGRNALQDNGATLSPEEDHASVQAVPDTVVAVPGILGEHSWNADSSWLQPENLSAVIIIKKRRQRSFAEVSLMPFFSLQQQSGSGSVSRVSAAPGIRTEFVASQVDVRADPGWGIHLGAGRQLNARWQLMAGLQYAGFKEKVRLEGKETIMHYAIVKRLAEAPGGPSLIDDTVKTYQTGRRVIDAVNSYTSWSLPLLAGYEVYNHRRLSLQLQGGPVLHLARRYRNSIEGDFAPDNAGKNDRSSIARGIDLQAGLRLMFLPQHHWQFFAEPSFRYSFLPLQTREMLQRRYLHQAGLMIGVRHGF